MLGVIVTRLAPPASFSAPCWSSCSRPPGSQAASRRRLTGHRTAVRRRPVRWHRSLGPQAGTQASRRRRPASRPVVRGSTLISWEPSVARHGVVGYDVYLDSRMYAHEGTRLSVCAALRAVASWPASSLRSTRGETRSHAHRATIQVPGCSTSRPGWVGGFETGDLSQWDLLHAASLDRFRVVTSDAGVTPRLGSHMARVEVRGNEPASWSAGTNVALIEKSSGPDGSGQLGADTYVGFSVFLPKGFPYRPEPPREQHRRMARRQQRGAGVGALDDRQHHRQGTSASRTRDPGSFSTSIRSPATALPCSGWAIS